MKYMNLKTFLLGSVGFMALCSTTMLLGCAEENDPAVLACFTRICTDNDEDDTGHSGKKGETDTRYCDYTASGKYAISTCDIDDLGKTMYSFDEGFVYGCEIYSGGVALWVAHRDISDCRDYHYSPQNYSSSSTQNSSSSQTKGPEGCTYYDKDVDDYICDKAEYGATVYSESTGTIFGCDYSKQKDEFTWIEYPRLKSCYDFEPDPYDP